ncbi:hypothetical protein MBLNU459_g2669t1 [Dothideomycetes sp. NU459]
MAAAASDKARFYMEQSVPELQEYERKKIFTKDEITAIARKRSEFEHIINMPGQSTPSDYARYAQYEMNLDTLRKKRSKRLGVKSTAYTGQRKIFFVLERGVRKFQGDMGLWMQYLHFVSKEAANKKLAKALTQCLRLHPVKWELWAWAAKHYNEEQADMQTARSYMQRGLRFCKREKMLWLEYAKLEMIYVAKIAARRQILGLDVERKPKQLDQAGDFDADTIALPDVTAADLEETGESKEAIDEVALQKLAASPALSGDIPLVIFDTAMREFNDDPLLAEQFFNLFTDFDNVPCTAKLLQHVIARLGLHAVDNLKAKVSLVYCSARLELLGLDAQAAAASANFPLQLGKALALIKNGMGESPKHNADLAEKSILLLLPYLRDESELDEGVRRVLKASVSRYLRVLTDATATPATAANRIGGLEKKLLKENRGRECRALMEMTSNTTPAITGLLQIKGS